MNYGNFTDTQNVKLKPDYKANPSFIAKFICLSFIIGVTSIISPFIIRSVIDGFLISQDRSAVMFALMIVAAFEVTSFGSDFILRNLLSEMAYNKLFETKKSILNLFAQKRLSPNSEKFLRTWEVDIKRVVNYEMKQKWMRYKDLFLLCLLSFVMISISSYAGFFILAVIIIQFSLAAWDVSRNKDDIFNLRSTEENEYDYLKNFFSQLQNFYDKNLVAQELTMLNKAIENASRQNLVSDERRSFLMNLKVVSKGFLIVGALAIAAFGGVDMSWAAGTFWALLMIVFRLTNPISSIAQWFFTEKSLFASKNRIDDLIAYLDEEGEHSIFYQQFKNSIGKAILDNQNTSNSKALKIQIITPQEQMIEVNTAVRLWSSKFLWQKNKILEFSEIEKIDENTNFFLFSDKKLNFKIGNIKSNLVKSVTVITHLPISKNEFDRNYFWEADKNKFTELNDSKIYQNNLRDAFKNQSTDWKEAFRDFSIYSKIMVPFEIVIFKSESKIDRNAYASTLRDVDHLLLTSNGHLVYILVASNGIGHSSLFNRLSSQNLPVQLHSHKFLNPKRENWKQSVSEAENFIVDSVFENQVSQNQGAA